MLHRYHVNLFWSDEDEGWVADVPNLTYCSAHGPTPEAALAEVETAIAAWLAAQADAGRPTPHLCCADCGTVNLKRCPRFAPAASSRQVLGHPGPALVEAETIYLQRGKDGHA